MACCAPAGRGPDEPDVRSRGGRYYLRGSGRRTGVRLAGLRGRGTGGKQAESAAIVVDRPHSPTLAGGVQPALRGDAGRHAITLYTPRGCGAGRAGSESLGEIGEIAIRGHNIMKGYWQRPEATAEAIPDGWSAPATWAASTRTATSRSSIGEGRIRGGYNVYPREIEESSTSTRGG
jgi:acyl-CoA synthetase (AMP-forming)/AMP-acid ligase II